MTTPNKPEGLDMTDHDIAMTVNQLRDIAKEYGQTQQLRERIAAVVVPLLSASKPAAPAQSGEPAAPEGWKLVPVEPTEGMFKAADEAMKKSHVRCAGDEYEAMLRSAPEFSDR